MPAAICHVVILRTSIEASCRGSITEARACLARLSVARACSRARGGHEKAEAQALRFQ